MIADLWSEDKAETVSNRITVSTCPLGLPIGHKYRHVGKGEAVQVDNEIPTLFDEYRQIKGQSESEIQRGTGLSITKKFAELLGGSIGVESEVGKGSTFKVTIPIDYKKGS